MIVGEVLILQTENAVGRKGNLGKNSVETLKILRNILFKDPGAPEFLLNRDSTFTGV